MSDVHFLLMFVLMFMLYFIPSIVALGRNHNNDAPIIIVNLFFGWSFIGWVVALAWACSDNVHQLDNRSFTHPLNEDSQVSYTVQNRSPDISDKVRIKEDTVGVLGSFNKGHTFTVMRKGIFGRKVDLVDSEGNIAADVPVSSIEVIT